jgi:hypothetical protein
VSCSPRPDADDGRCTTRLENTHGTEFREVQYVWHPWFGLSVGVHAAIEKPDGVVLRCTVSDCAADRWLEVPAWIFDRAVCGALRRMADPHADAAALAALADLLYRALKNEFASSNAPFSGASRAPRNQNRITRDYGGDYGLR